jgi:hypothetical protein
MKKAFWDETKSFLQYKAISVALKRGKNSCELDFPISKKLCCPRHMFLNTPRKVKNGDFLRFFLCKLFNTAAPQIPLG